MLKSLLETIFKMSGSQAMPGASVVSLQLPANGVTTSFTATSDGFVCLRAVNATGAGSVQIETTQNMLLSLVPISSTLPYAGVFLPVKKGETYSTIFRYQAAGDSTLVFIPTAGSS